MKARSLMASAASNSVLQTSLIRKAQSTGKSGKRSLLFAMNLTTLIDAFCILVIFLLSNMQGRLDNLELDKNLVLPAASQSSDGQSEVIVKLTKNGIEADNKKMTMPELIKWLRQMGQKSLVIQADKNSPYSELSPIIRAAGISGYESYLFAVIPGKEI